MRGAFESGRPKACAKSALVDIRPGHWWQRA